MREAERATLSAPTIFEGIAQSAEWMRHMHQVRRREPFCPHHLSLWCSPDNTSASRAGDRRSEAGQGRSGTPIPARGSRRIADPPDSESGSLGRASRLAPTNFSAPKAFLAMHFFGREASSVQLRVGAPVLWPPCQTPQSSQQLRRVSYARRAQGSTGDCDHLLRLHAVAC